MSLDGAKAPLEIIQPRLCRGLRNNLSSCGGTPLGARNYLCNKFMGCLSLTWILSHVGPETILFAACAVPELRQHHSLFLFLIWNFSLFYIYGSMVQWLACLPSNPKVMGSSPEREKFFIFYFYLKSPKCWEIKKHYSRNLQNSLFNCCLRTPTICQFTPLCLIFFLIENLSAFHINGTMVQ